MTNDLLIMGKYLRISSYIRKPFLIYDFAAAPLSSSLYMRKILFSFLSVHKAGHWQWKKWATTTDTGNLQPTPDHGQPTQTIYNQHLTTDSRHRQSTTNTWPPTADTRQIGTNNNHRQSTPDNLQPALNNRHPTTNNKKLPPIDTTRNQHQHLTTDHQQGTYKKNWRKPRRLGWKQKPFFWIPSQHLSFRQK